jgi:hypothetical protein
MAELPKDCDPYGVFGLLLLLVIHLAQVISELGKNRIKLHDYFKISLISPD